MNIRITLLKYWQEKPLLLILLVSGFFRLLAVIFSKGYGMHDDHFLVVEAAQSWVDGADYNNWIPGITKTVTQPTGHPLIYSGLHYLLFRFLQFIGIYDPQIKMYFVRFILAIYSMAIIYFGYKIADKLSGIKAAKTIGFLLGLLWFMPMMSVRNLIEFSCIPPLMYATWLVVKNEGKDKLIPFLYVGLLLGLGFNIRFQTVIFIGGFGLAMLILKRWKESILIVFGFLIVTVIVQACTDMIVWKKPFMELTEYIRYNMENANTYGVQKWYNYLLLIAGIMVPPISLFIIFGYGYIIFKDWKKYLILFLPAFLFFVSHSSFPNKQERFILPAIPFIITLGYIGWMEFQDKSLFWQRNTKLLRGCWIFFWILNCIPLVVVSVSYSKKSRVESMVYLSHKTDIKYIMIEESQHDDCMMPPLFYLRKWGHVFNINKNYPLDSFKVHEMTNPVSQRTNYIVFVQEDDIGKRINAMKTLFPNLTYENTVEPGFLDKFMHTINPRNTNYVCFIYKTNE